MPEIEHQDLNRSRDDMSTYLLVYVTVGWSPTKRLMITTSTVDGGLRVDGQEPQFIHLC